VSEAAPIQAVIVLVTGFQQNCSVLWCPKTMRGAVVDPGGDLERILGAAKQHKATIEKIRITHGHIDHTGFAAERESNPFVSDAVLEASAT